MRIDEDVPEVPPQWLVVEEDAGPQVVLQTAQLARLRPRGNGRARAQRPGQAIERLLEGRQRPRAEVGGGPLVLL